MFPHRLGIQECTAIGMSEGPILCQNWDWIPSFKDTTVILHIEQEGKPSITMMTEAGIIGKIGFNSAGIGLCINILISNQVQFGVPIHVIFRGILNSSSINEAINKVFMTERASASNCLIGHESGVLLDLEVAPKDFDYLYPEDGFLIHTNHFISPKLRAEEEGLRSFPDSLIRYPRAKSLLQSWRKGEKAGEIQSILKDHFNFPDSICRHPHPGGLEIEQIETIASVIMDLKGRKMYLCVGRPCQNPYQFVSFKER